jgi:hypothetical protein
MIKMRLRSSFSSPENTIYGNTKMFDNKPKPVYGNILIQQREPDRKEAVTRQINRWKAESKAAEKNQTLCRQADSLSKKSISTDSI